MGWVYRSGADAGTANDGHRPLGRADAVALLVIALVAFGLGVARQPWAGFNPDESRWISRAHYLRDLADPFGPTWQDGYMMRGQPPLGSVMTGLGLVLQGRDLETNGPWDFSIPGAEGWQHNIDVGNFPTPDDLAAARRTNAALVGLTAVVLALVGFRLSGRVAGVAAGGLVAVHPFSAYLGSIATADALLGLLVALAALAAIALASRPTWPRALALGVLLGLGGGVKLSPLFVAVPLAGLGGLLLAARRRRDGRWPRPADDVLAWGLLGTPLVAAAVFVATNPYLWPDPVGRTANLFAFRTAEMAAQSHDWPVMAVPTRAEALHRVGVNFGERFSILGGLAQRAGLPGGTRPPEIELLAAVAGLLCFAALALVGGPRGAAGLALVVLGGQTAVTLLGMRSEFDRYHVPMLLLGAVAVGLLAAALPGCARAGRRALTTARPDPRRGERPEPRSVLSPGGD